MLRTDLIDLINSGNAWAFVGAGASVDAGCPTWRSLVEKAIAGAPAEAAEWIARDSRYKAAFRTGKYDVCFRIIEEHAGRQFLEETITAQIKAAKGPGKMTTVLADLPFAGYLTTNYDGLLEAALAKTKTEGWIPIGNEGDELRKLSGDVRQVVWHVHGAAGMSDDRSRLILTDKDYDRVYLEDTPVVMQLRSVLSQHRIVFFGFSFNDAELLRILKRLGQLSNPARPIYAVVPGLSASARQEMLSLYNVDVIPYQVTNDSYEHLYDLLAVYSALVLRRSLKFDQIARPCPQYDPETTGLLLYNELTLKKGAGLNEDVLGALLRARTLSLLKHRGPQTVDDLVEDLHNQVQMIGTDTLPAAQAQSVAVAVEELIEQDLAKLCTTDGMSKLELTDEGRELTANQAAASQRLEDQFRSSLETRSDQLSPGAAKDRVARAAEAFIKECLGRRALGTAMAMNATRVDLQMYHIVALLQALPQFMQQLSSPPEAAALSRLVRDVLASPTQAESVYMGLALQSCFGLHLLGYDPDALRVRIRDLQDTAFLVDSSTLISFLARSCIGHDSAQLLIQCLSELNATVATTKLLLEEVAEHAGYAIERVESGSGHPNPATLRSATGRSGEGSNDFLDGFLVEVSRGTVLSIYDYLGPICTSRDGSRCCRNADVAAILENEGIYCSSFARWKGIQQEMYAEREDIAEKIKAKRQERNTFKHSRQVKAEAEALIIIQGLRSQTLAIDGRDISNAYFISHTRVIEAVAGTRTEITMRPEAVLQWVATLRPCSNTELTAITNSLLWEMSQRGFAIVDREHLHRAFSPLVDASRRQFQEEHHKLQSLTAKRFGVDASRAFSEAEDLELPVAIESVYAQENEELSRIVAAERKKAEEMAAKARMSDAEREELARLRAEKAERSRKSKAQGRSASNRKKKKRH